MIIFPVIKNFEVKLVPRHAVQFERVMCIRDKSEVLADGAIKIFGNCKFRNPKKTFEPRKKLLAISEEHPLHPSSACRASESERERARKLANQSKGRRGRRPISRALNTPPRKGKRKKKKEGPVESDSSYSFAADFLLAAFWK